MGEANGEGGVRVGFVEHVNSYRYQRTYALARCIEPET